MHRLLAGMLLLGLLVPSLASTASQPATPAPSDSALARMGYPELTIRVSDDRFEMPGQVPAGRTLITLDNVGRQSRHSTLLRLPDGMTLAEILAGLGNRTAPPPWYLASTFVGFPGETGPGQTNRAVVDLAAGLYLVADDFVQPFLVLPVGNATPAAVPTPTADGKVSLFEYSFKFPATIAPGRHVWQVTNAGREVHELMLAKVPDGTTVEQIASLVNAKSGGTTPAAGGLSRGDLVPAGGIGMLSPGAVGWTEVNLEPGTYAALCFAFGPDLIPHVMKGMIAVFTVA